MSTASTRHCAASTGAVTGALCAKFAIAFCCAKPCSICDRNPPRTSALCDWLLCFSSPRQRADTSLFKRRWVSHSTKARPSASTPDNPNRSSAATYFEVMRLMSIRIPIQKTIQSKLARRPVNSIKSSNYLTAKLTAEQHPFAATCVACDYRSHTTLTTHTAPAP